MSDELKSDAFNLIQPNSRLHQGRCSDVICDIRLVLDKFPGLYAICSSFLETEIFNENLGVFTYTILF